MCCRLPAISPPARAGWSSCWRPSSSPRARQIVRQLPAGVLFMADAAAEMRANLNSRIATRILRKVGFTRLFTRKNISTCGARAAVAVVVQRQQDHSRQSRAQKCAAEKGLNFITSKSRMRFVTVSAKETRERPSVDTEFARRAGVRVFHAGLR